MFKHYKDICDVVSLLVYCPGDKSYLLYKEASTGEYWIPSSRVDNNCWKMTAHKINFELFGMEAGPQCAPLRVSRVWLPGHALPGAYHAVYTVPVKADVKKRAKVKSPNIRTRLQWLSAVELDRLRVHCALRSPEVALFALMASGDRHNDLDSMEMECGSLIEICEENVIVGADVGGGAVALASHNHQLLQAAGYTRDDQIRLYREFMVMAYPALYISPQIFAQFMMDLGWPRTQCPSLFRAADVTGRGGLSFLELMLWCAALEPGTQHSGLPAEIRCRYIFRYFDSNRDLKLEYTEFKELVAATRAARQLPADALSVAKDADLCLRQLGLPANSPLPLAEFLRGVGELRLRGTSSLLRAPRSVRAYLADLQLVTERDQALIKSSATPPSTSKIPLTMPPVPAMLPVGSSASSRKSPATNIDYSVAFYTVKVNKREPHELLELSCFDEEAVSRSSACVAGGAGSAERLGPAAAPVLALAAVHYFATHIEPPQGKRSSLPGPGHKAGGKAAWSWGEGGELAALGALLLQLAAEARPLFAAEPRLLRISSPVYAIGDLHGNLSALLGMERALWGGGAGGGGAALAAARLLFLGDYVDRGAHGAELVAYLLAAKLQRPHAVALLRGNHETRDIQKMFTFYDECVQKFGETEGVKIWDAINDVFDVLPLAAIVDDKVFCCHGGIPPPWVCPLVGAIDKVPAPLPRPDHSALAWGLLWNDPVRTNKVTASLALELAANEGFAVNARRGTGHVFERAALDRFLAANRLALLLRAHEMHHHGFMCQLGGRVVSVFSSWRYCGGANEAAAALLDRGKLRLVRLTAD